MDRIEPAAISPSVWAHTLLRVRLAAGLLLAVAAGGAILRRRIAGAIDALVGSLWMSVRHACRGLGGRPGKFRFYLTAGSLYSFWVADEYGASHGYVAAGDPDSPAQ
jgi:hypothetical protein